MRKPSGKSVRKKRAPRPRASAPKEGARLNLSDLVAVLVVFAVVTAMAVPGFNRFLRSLDLNKQVQRVATMFRVVRQRAITDNHTCVVWWSGTDRGWGWWEDEDDDGVQEETEAHQAPQPLPAWVVLSRSGTNPFRSDTLRFTPDGGASESGTWMFSNPDGYTRSLSVVRWTGMVTVQ